MLLNIQHRSSFMHPLTFFFCVIAKKMLFHIFRYAFRRPQADMIHVYTHVFFLTHIKTRLHFMKISLEVINVKSGPSERGFFFCGKLDSLLTYFPVSSGISQDTHVIRHFILTFVTKKPWHLFSTPLFFFVTQV